MSLTYFAVALLCAALGYWCEWQALDHGWNYIRFNHFYDLIGVLVNLVLSSWNVWSGQSNAAIAIHYLLRPRRRSQAVRPDASPDRSGFQAGIDAHRKGRR